MASILYSHVIGIVASLRQAVSSPFFSGPLLLFASYAPEHTRHALAKAISDWPLLRTIQGAVNIKILRVLFVFSLLRQLNRVLNTMAANSWRVTATKDIWNWPDEIAVVTGGSSGIGKIIVERLAALGVRVAVLDVQEMPKEMRTNDRVRFFECDVTVSRSVTAAAEAVRREFGHPTILVNNAGVAKPLPILDMPYELLQKTFGVNTMAHWLTVQQFLPHMIQMNKGHVVTVASIASFVALPVAADYSASKAAALAFHEALTSEIKHFYKAPNVLTTVVHPHFVRTPLIKDFGDFLESVGTPMLTSEQVADPIIAQLKSCRGGQVFTPNHTSVVSGIRGWPTWAQEMLRDALARAGSGLVDL
ncbi:NAD(P)-binding protein [Xylariaceae sp. FL1272]|nr:NAD(P)-binding protein [Xylariaceae sp. FL1272]